MNLTQRSIGRENAIKLGESAWWNGCSARIAFEFQMHTVELAMPFDEFHRIAEEALGRSVWTHELASPDTLMAEFYGDKPRPTMDEIIGLLPADKVILIESNA